MTSQQENNCQSFYKGQNKEEIKKAFNEKWIEILKNCTVKKSENSDENTCNKTDKNVIINATNQYCSANLQKEELNNNEK